MPPKYGGGAETCHLCAKTAYPLESLTYDAKTYHKSCFKCTNCKGTLALINVAMIKGDAYCKPCYVRMFKQKGNYDVFGARGVEEECAPASPSTPTAAETAVPAVPPEVVEGVVDPMKEWKARDAAAREAKLAATTQAKNAVVNPSQNETNEERKEEEPEQRAGSQEACRDVDTNSAHKASECSPAVDICMSEDIPTADTGDERGVVAADSEVAETRSPPAAVATSLSFEIDTISIDASEAPMDEVAALAAQVVAASGVDPLGQAQAEGHQDSEATLSSVDA